MEFKIKNARETELARQRIEKHKGNHGFGLGSSRSAIAVLQENRFGAAVADLSEQSLNTSAEIGVNSSKRSLNKVYVQAMSNSTDEATLKKFIKREQSRFGRR